MLTNRSGLSAADEGDDLDRVLRTQDVLVMLAVRNHASIDLHRTRTVPEVEMTEKIRYRPSRVDVATIPVDRDPHPVIIGGEPRSSPFPEPVICPNSVEHR